MYRRPDGVAPVLPDLAAADAGHRLGQADLDARAVGDGEHRLGDRRLAEVRGAHDPGHTGGEVDDLGRGLGPEHGGGLFPIAGDQTGENGTSL